MRRPFATGTLAVLLLSMAACRSGGPPRPGLELVVEISREGLPATTERILIRPPFERRSGPEGAVTTLTGDGVSMKAGDGSTILLPGLPSPAWLGSDAVVRSAVELGLLTRTGLDDRLLDRPCVVVLSAEPLDAGTWRPPEPESETRSCVDEDGVVLLDDWFLGGRSVRARTVVERIEHADIDDSQFRVAATRTPSGLEVRLLDAPDGSFHFALPEPPLGFQAGPVAVFDRGGLDGSTAGHGERWVFTDGRAFLALEQERALDGTPVPLGDVTEIQFAGATATVRAGASGLDVSWIVGDTRITVSGTITLADLEAWAATFEVVDG